MRKVIITGILIISMLSMALVGSCGAFDYIDSVFDEIINGEITESGTSNESEKESVVESPSDSTGESESEGKDINALAYELVMVYSGVDYGSLKGLKLTKGNSYSLKLEVRTSDGEVLEDCNDFVISKIAMQGRFWVVAETFDDGELVDSGEGLANSEELTISGKKTPYFKISDFVTAELSDGYLNINAIKSEKDLSFEIVQSSTRATRFRYKGEYYDPRGGGVAQNVSWYVYVEEVTSGKGKILYLDF